MTLVRGADVTFEADLGATSFILDWTLMDLPDSLLTPIEAGFDEITCEVLSASWSWGANDPLAKLTEVDAGRMRVSLFDPTRRFDPANPGSPYGLFLRDGMPIRVSIEGAPAWTGTLEAWQWDVGSATATLDAIDAIGTLAKLTLPDPSGVTAGTTASQAAHVLDLIEWPVDRRVFVGSSAATRGAENVSGPALGALAQFRFAELGAMFATPDGMLAWWGRAEPLTPPAVSAVVNCGGVGLVALTTRNPAGRMRNIVLIDTNRYVSEPSYTRNGKRTVQTSAAELLLTGAGTPAADWAWAALGPLADPAALLELGTLVPEGPADVAAIAGASYGDRWRVVADDIDPPIDRIVRVLGAQVDIAPDTIEVTAVTEET